MDYKQHSIIIACVSSLLLVASCATVRTGQGGEAAGAESTSVETDDRAYQIGPDDVVHIMVSKHPELSGEFTVAPDGTIRLPGIGEFKAGGQTREGFRQTIESSLTKYINSPRVVLDIVKYQSEVVYVLGEVNTPGRYATEGKLLTVRDAVILAGLPARYAATERVFVITPSSGRSERTVVNLYRILYRGELERNIQLKPGDIVYVPQTLLGKISEFFSAILSPINEVGRAAAAPVP